MVIKMNRLNRLIQRYLLGKTPEQIEMSYLIEHGLKIGKDTSINSGFNIDSAWPWLISIGDRVTISTNVTILAHDASTNLVQQSTRIGRVIIGNDVFIGTRAIILCGVTIGNNVIIGAGSVVTHNLSENAVYAGVPAKRVCSIEEYREKYENLRLQSPNFNTIHPWNQWRNATEKEKKEMFDRLSSGVGFV